VDFCSFVAYFSQIFLSLNEAVWFYGNDHLVTKEDLNALQEKKLKLAAGTLHSMAVLFDSAQSFLPLWGSGVITHGVTKIKNCVIGITKDAKNLHFFTPVLPALN